jgi:quinol monooxygenase YgiN
MSITLLVTLVAKPESVEEIARVLEDVKSYLPRVDGCESVRICRGLDDPAVFTLIESWSSREKHETYQRGVAEAGGWSHFLVHLGSDPVSVYYEDF